jgi:deoxyxylulose-5-phosphate synthase
LINGHDLDEVYETIRLRDDIVVARTVKGRGYPLMEGDPKFHYRLPTESYPDKKEWPPYPVQRQRRANLPERSGGIDRAG